MWIAGSVEIWGCVPVSEHLWTSGEVWSWLRPQTEGIPDSGQHRRQVAPVLPFFTAVICYHIRHVSHLTDTLQNLLSPLLGTVVCALYRVGQKNQTVFWKFVTPVYVNIHGSYELLKTVRLFGPPCTCGNSCIGHSLGWNGLKIHYVCFTVVKFWGTVPSPVVSVKS